MLRWSADKSNDSKAKFIEINESEWRKKIVENGRETGEQQQHQHHLMNAIKIKKYGKCKFAVTI